MLKRLVKKMADVLRPHKKLFSFGRILYRRVYWMRNLRYPRGYMMDEQNKAAYLVISKAACSSIKASMYNDENIPDDYSVHSRKDRRLKSFFPFTDPEYFKFTYVRNPFERLVSCYEGKYRADKRKGKKQLVYEAYLFGLMKKDKGFEHFIKQVLAIPDWLADPHFKSQYSLVYHRGKSTMDFVGKMETIGETYPAIQEKYGYAPLKTYNKSGHADYRDYYTVQMAQKVYRKFKKDIEAFGYQEAYQDLLSYCQQKESGK